MSKKREALNQVLEDVYKLFDHNQLNESKDDKVSRSLKARIKENISSIVVQQARDILHESGMDDDDLASLSDDPSNEGDELLLGGDTGLRDAGGEIDKEELLVDGESEEEGEFDTDADDFDLPPSDDEEDGEGDDFNLGGDDEEGDEGDLDEADTFLTQEDIDAIEAELDGIEGGGDEGEGDFDDLDLDGDEPSLDDNDDSDDELSLDDGDDEPSLDGSDDEEWA